MRPPLLCLLALALTTPALAQPTPAHAVTAHTVTAHTGTAHTVTAHTVTVEAGAYERRGSVASFDVPDPARAYRLVDAAGRAVPLQQDAAGRAWFVVDSLAAGAAATYRLEPVEAAATAARVEAREAGGVVTVAVDGAPVLAYHARQSDLPRPDVRPVFRRGGYVHPVRTPSGAVVTDDYPPNHVHHHGVWAAWTKTVFQGRHPDFWNMGDSTGTVEPVALDSTWSGPVHAGLRARNRYVDLSAPSPVAALDETWEVTVYATGGGETNRYHVFDVVLVQEAADTLHLPEYHYGGIGFRGRREWDGADSTFFLTSEGRTRADGHATRARWCHVGGYVDGRLAGLAILGHPDNFRAPQPMRIHPTEPFFNFAPSQGGDWRIEPGRPYVARYRFVAADGPPDAALLDRLWNDYAHPVSVTVR